MKLPFAKRKIELHIKMYRICFDFDFFLFYVCTHKVCGVGGWGGVRAHTHMHVCLRDPA